MRYYIRQKVFSFSDKYAVKNENGEDAFFVQGKIFTLGAKLTLFDGLGRECLLIKQELFRLLPRYNVIKNGELLASVCKKFTLLKPYFEIDSASGGYAVEGDFFSMDFRITRGGLAAASISKKWFSWGDSYEIWINDLEDAAFFIALVIIIDNCIHNKK